MVLEIKCTSCGGNHWNPTVKKNVVWKFNDKKDTYTFCSYTCAALWVKDNRMERVVLNE